jgi:hypothetical protein
MLSTSESLASSTKDTKAFWVTTSLGLILDLGGGRCRAPASFDAGPYSDSSVSVFSILRCHYLPTSEMANRRPQETKDKRRRRCESMRYAVFSGGLTSMGREINIELIRTLGK